MLHRGGHTRKGSGLKGRFPQCRDSSSGLAEYFCPNHAPMTGGTPIGWDWGQVGPP